MENKYNIELEKDYLLTMNERIYEQLSFAETKNGVLVGIIGLVLFEIISIYSELSCTDNLLKVYLTFLFFHLILGLFLSLFSFTPIFKKIDKSCDNIYFWKDISCYQKYEDYKKVIDGIDEETALKLLGEQNIAISGIIKRKLILFELAIDIVLSGIFILYWIFTIIKWILLLINLIKNKKKIVG